MKPNWYHKTKQRKEGQSMGNKERFLHFRREQGRQMLKNRNNTIETFNNILMKKCDSMRKRNINVLFTVTMEVSVQAYSFALAPIFCENEKLWTYLIPN